MRDSTTKYLISLIVPVYNAKDYLPQTVNSVKAQTIGFENIELLLIDDHSTDGSFELMQSWAEENPNIRVLRTESNTGTPAGPRNIGLDNATAPYIMFLDNDDAFFPDAMKALYDEIERTGADLVTGDVALMNPGDLTPEQIKAAIYPTAQMPVGVFKIDEAVEASYELATRNHWCKIYRRSIVEQHHIRCPEGLLAEDIVFMYLYASFCKNVCHIRKDIYSYRVRPESLSHTLNKKFFFSLPAAFDFGLAEATRMGVAKQFVDFLQSGHNFCEFYIDYLLADKTFSEGDYADILPAWKNMLCYIPRYGGHFHSAYCKILSDDYQREEDDQALFHFLTLKELYLQRKQELDGIFSSNTYKLASRLASLKERLLGR